MFTRCPSCRAAFSITQQQLEIATGMVRCGMCEHVFDANLFLFNHSLEEEPSPATEDNQVDESNENHIDVELNGGDNAAIDLEVLDRELHSNQPKQISDITNIVNDEAPDEPTTSDQHEDASADDISKTDEVIPKIIADQVSNLEKEPTKFKPTQWLGVISIAALIAMLGLQVTAAWRLDLIPKQYQDPICKWITCEIETPRALSKIQVLNRSIYTHPTEPQALMVTLTIINRASFSQPYPIIQLRFLNISGNVIAARQFSANHYLQQQWSPQSLMTASTPLSIQLEVHDVGEEVVSYDFDFL